MDVEFDSLEALYQRLEPALNTKVSDLKRNDYEDVDPQDVWDYLSTSKWKHRENLLLHEMVDDILHASNEEIYQYKLQNKDR